MISDDQPGIAGGLKVAFLQVDEQVFDPRCPVVSEGCFDAGASPALVSGGSKYQIWKRIK